MILRSATLAVATLIGGCSQFNSCAPAAPAKQEVVAPRGGNCSGTISWDGRSPVRVVGGNDATAQRLLDAGNAVNIGQPGYDHVAGHYSTHGSIFRSGPGLAMGDHINYNCKDYTVNGRGSSAASRQWVFRAGLTVQYSGCGSVCLVFAQ